MKKKYVDVNGTDEQVVDDLERRGYIPVASRTAILNRIYRMRSHYDRAMQLFQRFDNDPVGNRTVSPITYQHERHYQPET